MTWIYFVLVDGQHVKIGKADNLSKRIGQHERGTLSTHQVDLLAAVKGCPADERHVQRFFEADAVESLKPVNNQPPEVFEPSPSLTNYIRWLRNQWFATVELDDEQDESVTFDFWEPNEDRQTPPASHPLFSPDWLEFNGRVITGDDYYTAPVVLDCARKCLGGFDLDPASHPLANRHVKATKFYSIQDNGLEQPWGGRVWLNPPFSQWKMWVPKIVAEYRSGRVQSMCVLSAMRTTSTKYFRELLDATAAMCIITGRIAFGGKGTVAPDDGHCVLYLGGNVQAFQESFQEIGSVWRKP